MGEVRTLALWSNIFLPPLSHSVFFSALPHTRIDRTAWQVGGVDAIAQWQRGVVAIGLRRDPLSESVLIGTGFIVDMDAGIISTCAHVLLSAFYDNEGPLDPGLSGANGGVAIGVGIGERIQWICRADLRCISQPPASYAQNLCSKCNRPIQGPQVAPQQRRYKRQCLNPRCLHPAHQQRQFLKGPPPSHWPVQDSADLGALDLALLQLADVSGQPLSEQTEQTTGEPLLTLWPRCLVGGWSPDLGLGAADHPRGLPIPDGEDRQLVLQSRTADLADLACALRLGHASTLQDGEPFVMLGYGQSDTGTGADRTSTTTRGHFSGSYASSDTGVWHKTTVTILSGHSGGPVLNRRGEVIGWAVMSDRSIGQLRPVERLLEALTRVLNDDDVAPGRAGDVTTVRDRLLGHIPECERLDLGDSATWEAAMRVLREATEAAEQAQAAAEQAHHHEQGAYAHALAGASFRDDAARQADSARQDAGQASSAASNAQQAAIEANEAAAPIHAAAAAAVTQQARVDKTLRAVRMALAMDCSHLSLEEQHAIMLGMAGVVPQWLSSVATLARIASSCILILEVPGSVAQAAQDAACTRPEELAACGLLALRVAGENAVGLCAAGSKYIKRLNAFDFSSFTTPIATNEFVQQEPQGVPVAAAAPAPSQPVMPPAPSAAGEAAEEDASLQSSMDADTIWWETGIAKLKLKGGLQFLKNSCVPVVTAWPRQKLDIAVGLNEAGTKLKEGPASGAEAEGPGGWKVKKINNGRLVYIPPSGPQIDSMLKVLKKLELIREITAAELPALLEQQQQTQVPIPSPPDVQRPTTHGPVHLRGYVVDKTVQQTTPPALDVLGAGSFSVVVKATRISDSEPVALKIMACRAFDGPDFSVVAARDEKVTLDTIGYHPNITQLKGWEEINPTDAEVALSGPLMQGLGAWMVAERRNDPGRPLPVVSYASAHTFCIAALQLAGEKEVFELVRDQGRFSAQLLRPVTMQLADALKHVHSRGFGHFNVKPENIRITCPPEGDPEVTLVSFGLAVNLGSGEHPTQRGTLGIAAPEFFTGTFADVDSEKIGAADIFSLGVVVFTLAFGYPPWAKATADGLGERNQFGQTCAIDPHGRGFLKYANLGEPGRLLAYIQQTPAFNVHLTPTGPTLPKEGEASQSPAGALVPPAIVPAPSDHRLIDLMSKMLQIDPAQRPTAQEILEHDWITAPAAAVPVPKPVPEPAPPAQSLYASCGAGSDAEPQFCSCGASDEAPQFTSCGASSDAEPRFRSLGASDEEPQFTSCGATAPASAACRSLGDLAPPDADAAAAVQEPYP